MPISTLQKPVVRDVNIFMYTRYTIYFYVCEFAELLMKSLAIRVDHGIITILLLSRARHSVEYSLVGVES